MTDMSSPPDATPAAKTRGKNRDSLFLSATLKIAGSGDEVTARVRNLSAGGMMAETPMQVIDGAALEVNLRNVGWISARVAWVAEGRIGVAFDHNIDPAHVRKPVGQSNMELPPHLRKLNEQQQSSRSKIRRA